SLAYTWLTYVFLRLYFFFFFFSSRRRHTRFSRDWSSDVCSSDLPGKTVFSSWKLPLIRYRVVLLPPDNDAWTIVLNTVPPINSFCQSVYRFWLQVPFTS